MRFFWLYFIICSCRFLPAEHPIVLPETGYDFYRNSAIKIIEGLKDESLDQRHFDLLFTYYDKLDWPLEAEAAFDLADKYGIGNTDLFWKKIDFLNKYHRYYDLSQLLESASKRPGFTADMYFQQIRCWVFLKNYSKALAGIDAYLKKYTNQIDYFGLSVLYQVLDNDVLALYYAGKANKNTQNDMRFRIFYAGLLQQYGFYEKMVTLFEPLHISDLTLSEKQFYTVALNETGNYELAVDLMLGTGVLNNALMSVKWLNSRRAFDRAMSLLDSLMLQHDNNAAVLLAYGSVEENRGYFNNALRMYERSLEIDTTLQIARDQIISINRKIAYLQKIRSLEQRAFLPELTTKKAIIQ